MVARGVVVPHLGSLVYRDRFTSDGISNAREHMPRVWFWIEIIQLRQFLSRVVREWAAKVEASMCFSRRSFRLDVSYICSIY
jgi:hypothetical protein